MTTGGVNEQKIAEILRQGGSLILHKNDLERLKEARKIGINPDIFKGVKVYPDRLGVVKEGQVIAAIMGGASEGFRFKDAPQFVCP